MSSFGGGEAAKSNEIRRSQLGFSTITEVDEDNLTDFSASRSSRVGGPRAKRTSFAVPAQNQQNPPSKPLQVQAAKRDSHNSQTSTGHSIPSAGESSYSSVTQMPHTSNKRANQGSNSVISAVRRLTSKFSSLSNHPSEHDSNFNRRGTSSRPPGGASTHTPQTRRYERRPANLAVSRDRESLGNRSSINSDVDYSTEGSGFPSDSNPREVTCLSETNLSMMRHIIDHPLWTGFTFFLTFVMLFGSQIQDIWIPKSWDNATDGVFTVAFISLLVDIIIRCLVDPMYFSWSCCNSNRSNFPGVSGVRPYRSYFCADRNGNSIRLGSFMFWCDVVATLTFLYDISYLNPLKRRPLSYDITLNGFGVPIRGLEKINMTAPISLEWELLITVGRSARVARFIRTSTVVEISDRFNCLQLFRPNCWRRHLQCGSVRNFNNKAISGPSQRSPSRLSAGSRPLANVENITNLGDTVGSRLSSSGNEHQLDNTGRSSLRSSVRSSGALQALEDDLDLPSTDGNTQRATLTKSFFNSLAVTIGIASSKQPDDSIKEGDTRGQFSTKSQKEGIFGINSKETSSHVGAAMRELTGQRVAMGIMLALLLSVVFTYHEADGTKGMTMVTLHGQTGNEQFQDLALDTARASVIPTLFSYERRTKSEVVLSRTYELRNNHNVNHLREREMLFVQVSSDGGANAEAAFTFGWFDNHEVTDDRARVELVTTLFTLFVWIIGVTSFAGPVMTLVVIPIERMVRLLSMLMKDPLGYQSTPQYRRFVHEDDDTAKNTMWTKEVLKGMETNFLMSTILRIGSLMKVGFGSAGVEIIRNNLEKGRRRDVLFLNKKGSTVSCIFLFCDIRQFTDATECLQEEVFVFTNKIAAVVHSICHSYGGSANKNIGDAFLLSWLLDEASHPEEDDGIVSFNSSQLNSGRSERLNANNNQADKALLSVVKISIALHFDTYFVESMNEEARNRLMAKLSKRKGPVVQMGFGLHAGKAVQGAIGSQRKLDATYISESVERAEFLESNTKKYGIPLLMSDAFYNLLEPTNRYRCRKIDQLVILSEEDDDLSDPGEILDNGEKMDIFTFDMDIDALWRSPTGEDDISTTDGRISSSDIEAANRRSHMSSLKRDSRGLKDPKSLKQLGASRRTSIRRGSYSVKNFEGPETDVRRASYDLENDIQPSLEDSAERPVKTRKLVLPTDVCKYSDRIWLEPEMKKIRRVFVSNGIFFPKFDAGLKSYYAKDWEHARSCFETVLSQIEDGPSRYYLKCMEEHNGKPPRNFIGYGR